MPQTADAAQPFEVEIIETTEIAEAIRELRLRPVEGALPSFSAGAHLKFCIANGQWNAYSLITLPQDDDTGSYRIAIRRDEAGAGGSIFMHGLKPGDRISAEPPRNDFALHEGTAPSLLIAGGIGLTPLISMATRLAAEGRDFRLIQAARNRAAAAYHDQLVTAFGDRVTLHLDDQEGGPLPLAPLLGRISADTHVYVCGPRPMIDATRAAFTARGLPEAQFHTELFETSQAAKGDQPFEVEIADGRVFTIPAGKTIIEVLEENDIDLVYDCQRGDCGICQTDVLEGTPDHRDVVLSEAERSSGEVMQICVSRALSARLKLDL
ncbi:MAG: PDR/VanB family oxidoreductase [Pseudorhodobacter sp.]